MYPFEAVSAGKWILLGEHSVIRNFPALVFPLKTKKLRLRFSADFDSPPVTSTLGGACRRALIGAKRFYDERGKSFHFPEGNFELKSSIPVSAGLGSSAALCVAIGRLLVHEGVAQETDLFELCRTMEDEFHGTSSGMDLAVILADRPLLFQRQASPQNVPLNWTPQIFLFDTGLRSSTQESVEKVSQRFQNEKEVMEKLDQTMAEAVLTALRALSLDEERGKPLLIEAIHKGLECFESWDLIPTSVAAQMKELRDGGALAVKPTGSGAGGFLLSLWDQPPSDTRLIPVF